MVAFVRDATCAGTAVLLVALSMASGAWAAPGETTRVSNVCPSDGTVRVVDAISADGRFLVVECGFQVYVRDLVLGATTLVSRASGDNGSTANGAIIAESLSADGRFLGLVSYNATNLSPADPDAVPDVFVRELGGPN
jgi:hypothetical protein